MLERRIVGGHQHWSDTHSHTCPGNWECVSSVGGLRPRSPQDSALGPKERDRHGCSTPGSIAAFMRISIRMGGRLIRDGLITSAAVWLGLMGYWALTEVLIGRYPPGRRQISPEGLTSLVIYATLGLAAS